MGPRESGLPRFFTHRECLRIMVSRTLSSTVPLTVFTNRLGMLWYHRLFKRLVLVFSMQWEYDARTVNSLLLECGVSPSFDIRRLSAVVWAPGVQLFLSQT